MRIEPPKYSEFVKYSKKMIQVIPLKLSKKTAAYQDWLYDSGRKKKTNQRRTCYACVKEGRESRCVEYTHIKLIQNKIYCCEQKKCIMNFGGGEKAKSPIWLKENTARLFTKQDIQVALDSGHLNEDNISFLRGEII